VGLAVDSAVWDSEEALEEVVTAVEDPAAADVEEAAMAAAMEVAGWEAAEAAKMAAALAVVDWVKVATAEVMEAVG
jgi:hypothetical protein